MEPEAAPQEAPALFPNLTVPEEYDNLLPVDDFFAEYVSELNAQKSGGSFPGVSWPPGLGDKPSAAAADPSQPARNNPFAASRFAEDASNSMPVSVTKAQGPPAAGVQQLSLQPQVSTTSPLANPPRMRTVAGLAPLPMASGPLVAGPQLPQLSAAQQHASHLQMVMQLHNLAGLQATSSVAGTPDVAAACTSGPPTFLGPASVSHPAPLAPAALALLGNAATSSNYSSATNMRTALLEHLRAAQAASIAAGGGQPGAATLASVPELSGSCVREKAPVLVQHGNSLVLNSEDDKLGGCSSGELFAVYDAQGRPRRSNKQQLQNKQAQARYRERQKHKLTEMERTIESLQEKVQLMHSLESSYSSLQAKAQQLEQRLSHKEQEIQQLKCQGGVQKQDVAVGATSSSDEASGEGAAAAARLPGEAGGECSSLPLPQTPQDAQRDVAAAVDRLHHFLDSHKLRAGAAELPAALNKQLGKLVEDAVIKRIRVKRTVKVSDLMAFDLRQLSSFECRRERLKWQVVTAALELTTWQQQNILALRNAYIERLQLIYAERQGLNMKAMSLMMPPHAGGGGSARDVEMCSAGDDKAGDSCAVLCSQLQCLSINGYLYASSSCTPLPRVLQEIRDNLRQEQKLIAEANYIMINRVMTALQAARFIVGVYPHYFDCLALANAMAISSAEGEAVEGDEEEAAGRGAGSESAPQAVHSEVGSPAYSEQPDYLDHVSGADSDSEPRTSKRKRPQGAAERSPSSSVRPQSQGTRGASANGH